MGVPVELYHLKRKIESYTKDYENDPSQWASGFIAAMALVKSYIDEEVRKSQE